MITIFNGRSRSLGSQPGKNVWVQVEVDLRKHLHLFKGAKLNVFLAIALHGNSLGWSKPSIRLLRRETGLSADTIFKALAELCELKIEGNRVLLRKGARQSGDGQFSNNNYLTFPTEEDIAKFESPYLFPCSPRNGESERVAKPQGAISEKPDTGKSRHGETPTSSQQGDSKFSTKERLQYARSQERFLGNGWVAASADGRSDELIQEFFDRLTAQEKRLAELAALRGSRDREEPEPEKRGPFESACDAVSLAMSVNGITLAEAIVRLREASSHTPGASSAEASLTWEKVLTAIKGKLSSGTVETWFEPIRCERIAGAYRTIFLCAPNQAVRDWIKVNYSNLIDQALGETGLAGYAIEWVTAGDVLHPSFREIDEALVQRVITYFVMERGCKYEPAAEANTEVA